MFGRYDICFCMNKECPHTDCGRHYKNTPSGERYLSMANFQRNEDGSCNHYFKERN